MYKNLKSGINNPEDLAGKRIGLSSYQNTLGVRAKGDLSHFYGVPWKSVTWVAAGEDVVRVELPKDVKLERAKNMAEIEDKFVKGPFTPCSFRIPRPVNDGDLTWADFSPILC
jgi:4,5-dihydroxyphthalate decarboxylase